MNEYNLKIISLIHNSPEFAKLHSRFSRFNPFKILRVDQFEIRHSNILSWLLNPNENHQLGSFFVKKLLARTFLKEENEALVKEQDMMWLHKLLFHDLHVQREVKTSNNKRIDLLASSESQKFVLLIENKYKSGESEGQLDEYLSFVRKHFEGCRIIPIFLSLDSSEPSNKEYFILSYTDILGILKEYMDVNGSQLFEPVKEFISYYIDILEDELVQDEEEITLAIQVYKEYKDAVDFLYICANNNRSNKFLNKALVRKVISLSAEDKEIIQIIYFTHQETVNFIYTMGNSVIREAFINFAYQNEISEENRNDHIRIPSFVFPEWRSLDGVVGVPTQDWWLNNALIVWFERLWDNKLKLTVEVGPLPYDERIVLLNTLEKYGIRIKDQSKEERSKYTRIYSSWVQMNEEDFADQAKIIDAMNVLYQSEDFNQILSAVSKTVNELVNGVSAEEEVGFALELAASTPKEGGESLKKSFAEFIDTFLVDEGNYRMDSRKPHFILHEFRHLEAVYGSPRWNWWLNNCLIMWFEKLPDNRLKFIIEVGPLESEKRLQLINRLEAEGIKIRSTAKEPNAAYTRIFTGTKLVQNWEDENEVLQAMNQLYHSKESMKVIEAIQTIASVNP